MAVSALRFRRLWEDEMFARQVLPHYSGLPRAAPFRESNFGVPNAECNDQSSQSVSYFTVTPRADPPAHCILTRAGAGGFAVPYE